MKLLVSRRTTFGVGESAAIAAAHHRGLRIAIEDRAARRRAESLLGRTYVLSTQHLIVGMIQATLLTVAEADEIKADWEANHRFALAGFVSFAELVRP